MITLDTNILSLLKQYEISTSPTNLSAYKSIEEFKEAQAAGNVSNNKEVNIKDVIKALELEKPEKKYSILRCLNHTDLIQLMYMMEKEDLAVGLKFFTKEKLMNYMYNMPKSDLLDVLFKVFKKEEILELMDVKALKHLLGSENIDKSQFYEVIYALPPSQLAQIYEAATGESVGKMSNQQLLDSVYGLNKEKLVDGLRGMNYKQMLEIVQGLTKNNEDLFMDFKTIHLMRPMTRMTKLELSFGMEALDPEKLINIVGTLPDNLIAQVVTLMDTEKLTEALEKFHSSLLMGLVS